jgi:hypothetical protein
VPLTLEMELIPEEARMPAKINPRGTYLKIAEAQKAQEASQPDLKEWPSARQLMVTYGISRGVALRVFDALEKGVQAWCFPVSHPSATRRHGCGPLPSATRWPAERAVPRAPIGARPAPLGPFSVASRAALGSLFVTRFGLP